jgi:hypothetical protein
MTLTRSVTRGSWLMTAVAIGLFAAPLVAQNRPAPRPASAPLIDATHPFMQAEEVAIKGDTVIFGDPSKMGPYVLRRKLTANQTARPHYEDQDRWVTVLQGTLWIGKGDVFSPDKLLPIREGGVAYLPANTHYFEMAGENEVLVQVTGSGPVKSVHTEVDAKGQPVPEGGPYPVLAGGRRRNMPVDPDLIDPDQLDQMERAAAARREAEAAKAKAGAKPATPAAEPKK